MALLATFLPSTPHLFIIYMATTTEIERASVLCYGFESQQNVVELLNVGVIQDSLLGSHSLYIGLPQILFFLVTLPIILLMIIAKFPLGLFYIFSCFY